MTSASLASSSSRPGPTGQCIPETIECLTFSKTVLLTAALTKDIGGLIQAYKEKNSFEYPPFATLWKSRQFSLIHFTCNDPQSRDTFIDGLTEVLFRYYLSPRETMTVHAGAVYALYLLYFTQPTSFPKVPIRLTIHAWHVLESIYKQAFVHKATDLIYVIRKLRDSHAFVYVAQGTPVSKPVMGNNEFVASEVEKKLIQTERAMHDEVLVPIEPLLSDLSSLAGQYRKAKMGLVSLALARRSSELVMQQLLRAKPTDMNLKEAKPLPQFLTEQSTLGAVQQTTVPSSITAAATMAESSNARRTLLSDDNSDIDMEIHAGSTVPSMRPAIPQSYGQSSSATTSAILTQGSTAGPNRASTMTGSSNAPVASSVRQRSGETPVPQSTLPSAFPMSMLQATTSSIGSQVEDMVRDYYRHRLLRFEYAGSGGLSLNENEYPEEFLLAHRMKKRELEEEKRAEEKRERKSQRAKRRHEQKLRKTGGDEGSAHGQGEGNGDGDEERAAGRVQQQHGQGQGGEEVIDMEGVIVNPRDQHMAGGHAAAMDKGEPQYGLESRKRGLAPQEWSTVTLDATSHDDVMADKHRGGSASEIDGLDSDDGRQGEVEADLQTIEGAESLVQLQKHGHA
ncbi:small nuclear RNA activating complex, subunit SNAP43-domain-containing protein [Linnemannia elongata]|nr:small nuclear RNA activating complex, subunit SNAP43-domain-containing protein [Linnemannia elongata]